MSSGKKQHKSNSTSAHLSKKKELRLLPMQLVHTVLLKKEERPKMSTVKRVAEKGLRVKKKKTGRLFTNHPCTARCLVSIARNTRETRLINEGSELSASGVLQSSTGTEKADVNLTKEAVRWRKVDDTAPTYGDC